MNKLFLFLLLLISIVAKSQQNFVIEENKPVDVEGIEYGFVINNESTRDVGDRGKFSRYEITVYAVNKSNCSRVILTNPYTDIYSSDQNIMARFDCSNATGYRLTSKSTSLRMSVFNIPVKREYKDDKGKTQTTTENVNAGYIFRKGQTSNDKFTVIVPLNERPQMLCFILNTGNVL